MGAAYVAGTTDSSDFPTSVGAFDTSRSAWGDAAVVKLAADGKTLVYGTYLGGADAESANGIAVDGAGAAYVAGYTQSADFPTTADAYDVTANGGYDFFITKVNADGKGLAYSTYVGGASHEYCNGMTIDGDGCAYVTGNAMSDNFPTTAGAFGVTRSGEEDVAVVKLSADGKSLAYSTLLGGSGSDLGYSIAVDSGKAAYVTGATWSSQFPTTADAYDTTHNGTYDVFVAKVAADGKALAYATFLGGASADYGKGIAVSGTGSVTVAGYTSSSDFPTTAGAYDTSYNGNAYDAIVARFSFGGAAPTLAVDSLNVTEGTRVSLRGRMTDAASAGISGKRLQFSIDFGAWANSEILTNATGYATLTLTAPAAGVHTLACRFEAADGIPEGSGSGTLTTTSLLATTTAVMDRTAGPSDAVSLLAYLQTQSRAGIAGKQMEFQFNGGSWTPASAVTEATGKATLAVTAPATAGDYTINARFIGDATYTASSGTAKLTVAAKRSVYVYTMNRSGKVGAAGTLIAYFYWYQKNGTLTPVSGKSLRFVCAGVSLDSTVATDAAGRATVSVTPATVGAFPFTVDFTADADYNAGSGSGTLTVAP
ncbi:MAG: SBBP repeat-containing protein [Armatimonadetes bacterium]|nr:SBBP repeat-containing protein [Armatimonadota bacterium]